ncbi:MAG: hypothetical protein KJ593_03450 [Candidatus Omnitrophica bacterium]|nr:hypothetical protein [Candidatus Omnitrophota bacterium]
MKRNNSFRVKIKCLNLSGFTFVEALIIFVVLFILVFAGTLAYIDMREKARKVQEEAIIAAMQTGIRRYHSQHLRWSQCPPLMSESDFGHWWFNNPPVGNVCTQSQDEIVMPFAPEHNFNSYGIGDNWGTCLNDVPGCTTFCGYSIYCSHISDNGISADYSNGNVWYYYFRDPENDPFPAQGIMKDGLAGQIIKNPTCGGHQ